MNYLVTVLNLFEKSKCIQCNMFALLNISLYFGFSQCVHLGYQAFYLKESRESLPQVTPTTHAAQPV